MRKRKTEREREKQGRQSRLKAFPVQTACLFVVRRSLSKAGSNGTRGGSSIGTRDMLRARRVYMCCLERNISRRINGIVNARLTT